MCMGSGLAIRVGAVAGVLEGGNGFAECSLFCYAIGRGATPVIVGHKSGLAGKVDGDFARAAAEGRNSVERLQLAGGALDGKGTDGTAFGAMVLIHFVDRVEVFTVGRQGEKAGVDGCCRQPYELERACIRVPAIGVDSLTGAAFVVGVGAGKEELLGFTGLFACPGTDA